MRSFNPPRHRLSGISRSGHRSALQKRNRRLAGRLRNLTHVHRELEFKQKEIEAFRDELKKQNIQLIKNAIELSDVMRQLEDKNYDLKQLFSTLEDQVNERTEALIEANKKLVDEIREKTQAQAAFKESEEKYRIIFEHSGTAIFILEADTSISMANAMSSELTGVPAQAIEKGMRWTTFVAGEDTRKRMVEYHKARRIKPDAAPPVYEFKLRHSSGAIKDVLVHVTTIDGTDRSIASMIDITTRRKIAEEKKALEKKLQQAQKMEAIGTLAGGIAHDFNNILAALMGNIGMAQNAIPQGTNVGRWLGNAMQACMRARDLVLQILTFSRQNEQEMKTIQMVPIIYEAVRFLRSSIPSTIEFNVSIDCSGEQVMGNSTQIHQVIMNLCTNAAYAMEGKPGHLGIHLKPFFLEDDAARKINLQAGSYIELKVSDTGSGIPSSIIDQIFNPFFTTKKIGEGTGMGLAVTHGIVQRMGGAITVESDRDSGTVFRVYLPVVQGKPELSDIEYPQIAGKKERILIVDDDENVLTVMEEMIAYLGYRVVSMMECTEALKAFKANPAGFDLVITDHTMPLMTGVEFSRRLMAIRPDLPIILYTGYRDAVNLSDLGKQGIAEILMKPIEPRHMSHMIHRALHGYPSGTPSSPPKE